LNGGLAYDVKNLRVHYTDPLASRGILITICGVVHRYIKTSLSLNALTGQGGKYGKMDETTAKGMDPDDLALRILKSAAKGKHEMVFAPIDARAAIFLRNLLPDLLFWILAKKARKALQQENKAD
jgi:dehydrogenase/reductase SDR family protein 7B